MGFFCPLAVDIGNVAEWFAGVVAVAGAVAVFMVSRAANASANSANKTAAAALAVSNEAKDIQKRDEEVKRTALKAEELLILVRVGPEIKNIHSILNEMHTDLTAMEQKVFAGNEPEFRTQSLQVLSLISVAVSEALFSRWYVLSTSHASDLAFVVGIVGSLRMTARDVFEVDRQNITIAYPDTRESVFERKYRDLISDIDSAIEPAKRLMIASDDALKHLRDASRTNPLSASSSMSPSDGRTAVDDPASNGPDTTPHTRA